MKIVLIGPTYPFRGGTAHYTTMLHRTLTSHGHDAVFVSFKNLYPGWLFPGESNQDPSKQPLRTENVHYSISSLNPVSWLTTAAWIRRSKPDLVVLSWWTTFLSPAWLTLSVLLRVLLRVPLIYLCHNVLPHEARWWDQLMARLVLSTQTGHIVQSDAERTHLHDLLSRASPVVVPTPVFDMFCSELPSKEQARRRLGLSMDVPVLLFFGIVREYKGLMDLLEAVPAIRDRLGDVRLMVAGEFWEPREQYDLKIHELGIEDNVRIDDRYVPNKEVPSYFVAADLVVAPASEGDGEWCCPDRNWLRCPIGHDAGRTVPWD